MSVSIIINADDLGKSHLVNKAISEALSLRVITSSTIMANSSTWEEVHAIVDENPQASFGVHLNLTEGKALTDSMVFRQMNIVDNENRFTKKVRNLKNYTPELLKAVYEEWDAQINKVINIEKIPVTHFDGHHHIHREYVFRNVLVSLCEKYHIHMVRNRYTSPLNGFKNVVNVNLGIISLIPGILSLSRSLSGFGGAFSFIYSTMESDNWRRQIKRKACVTDYFNAYESECMQLARGKHQLKDCTIELMCHPGHPNYIKEYELIKAHTIEKCCANCKLISYKELK